MIDTATAKQLLQSTDVSSIQTAIQQSRDYLKSSAGQSMDTMMQLQYIKLLILLHNRLLQLQTTTEKDNTKESDIANTYAGMAYCWNLMNDGEKCEGQIKKALSHNSNCIDALLISSELHSNQARFDLAVTDIQQVIKIIKETNDSSTSIDTVMLSKKYALIEADLKLSAIYEMKGDFDDAIKILKDSKTELQSLQVGEEDKKQIQYIKIEIYGRLGTIQDKLALYHDAIDSLDVAVTELQSYYGSKHIRTQEMEYILDMAKAAAKN